MTEVRTGDAPAPLSDSRGVLSGPVEQPRDLQRTFQLVLATVWLLDAVLQLQPLMFARGSERLQRHVQQPRGQAIPAGWRTQSPGTRRTCTTTRYLLTASSRLCSSSSASASSGSDPSNPPLHSPSSGPWVSGGSGKAWGTSFTVEHPIGRRSGWRALLCSPGGPALAECGLRHAVRRCSERRGDCGEGDLAAGVGPAGSLGRRRGGTLTPGAARPGGLVLPGQPGWLAHIDRSTESLLLRHGTTIAILLAVVCVDRGDRRLPAAAIHQGHPSPSGL